MNAIKSLNDFIDNATTERKYAANTARGLKAALKLFEPNLNDAEKESLDTLESNLDNIANDIYTKQKNSGFSSKTLMAYKQRITKVIADYRMYGSSPGKMAAWNPRRSTTALKTKSSPASNKKKRESVPEAQIIEMDRSQVLRLAEPSVSQGGITSFDVSGRYGDINRSEIFLRDGFKITLELPIDLNTKEANKLKQYIDLMVMDQ